MTMEVPRAKNQNITELNGHKRLCLVLSPVVGSVHQKRKTVEQRDVSARGRWKTILVGREEI